MPSPQVIAREPGRRIQKSSKPERRRKQKVEVDDGDDIPAPAQQSAKAGAGVGGGRERSRRITMRAPKTAGAKAKTKSKDTTMMDKGVEKKLRSALSRGGRSTEHLSAPEEAVRGQPRRQGAKKQSRAAKAAAKGAKSAGRRDLH